MGGRGQPELNAPATCSDVNALPDDIYGVHPFTHVDGTTFLAYQDYARAAFPFTRLQGRRRFECEFREGCVWDGSLCADGPCVGLADPACHNNAGCMRSAHGCVPKECSKWVSQAECDLDAACGWAAGAWAAGGVCVAPEFVNCPNLDLTLLLDGSGSMFSNFVGDDTYGWWKMLLELRRWFRKIPLTGRGHGAAPDAAAPGFGVDLIQFSAETAGSLMWGAYYSFGPITSAAGACPVGAGACTAGEPSGSADELIGDLYYFSDSRYAGLGTFLGPALALAEPAFAAGQAAGRKQVAVVITDGQFSDLSEARKDLYPDDEARLQRIKDDLDVELHVLITLPDVYSDSFRDKLLTQNAHVVTAPESDHMHATRMSEVMQQFFEKLCDDIVPAPVNECDADPCAGAVPPQTCSDPDPALTNWRCECTVGTARGGTGEAGRAQCDYDECQAPAAGFAACGALCTDVNATADRQNDFQCSCPPGWTGAVGVGAAAAGCELDECAFGAGKTLCVDAGYACDDTANRTHEGNYNCSCVTPRQGWALGGAPACTLNECLTKGVTACAAFNQTCIDNNEAAPDDFVCTCAPPLVGNATGVTARCTLDECANGGAAVCGNQTCVDADQSPLPLGNFVCVCAGAGEYGNATGAPAGCRLNECDPALPLNATCAADLQECVEPDPARGGDAYCRCPSPMGAQTQVGGAVGRCEWNECVDHRATCTAGQECIDADNATMNTWVCACVAPMEPVDPDVPVGNQTAADCHYVGDCDSFSFRCSGTVPAQVCGTGAAEYDDRVACHCPDPYVGADGDHAPAANCTLNECEATCDWCDKTMAVPNGTCAGAGQRCVDTNHNRENDWRCVCQSPYDFADAPRGAAACPIDECATVCDHCADAGSGHACTAANQTCVDPSADRTVYGNWYCECKLPLTLLGPRVDRAAATCERNECGADGGQAVCMTALQQCIDNDTAVGSLGDWYCECPAPSETTERGNVAAECHYDECSDPAVAAVCTDEDQDCYDANTTAPETWACRCRGVAAGNASLAAAHCVIDECAVACPHCANAGSGNVCEDAGQACYEPDDAAEAEGDWWCVCTPNATHGAQARPQAAVPACPERDECRDPSGAVTEGTHALRYTAEGCLCQNQWRMDANYCVDNNLTCSGDGVDTPCPRGCCNPDGDPAGDWCLLAAHPYNGAKAACADTWGYCAPLGVLPAGGGVAAPFPRNQSFPGVDDDESNVCADAGQTCRDTPGSDGTWACECPWPLYGTPAQGDQGPTTCLRDECAEHNMTCAAAPPAGSQRCVDDDHSPASLGTWYCECVDGGEQNPRGAVPACPLDECVAECPLCAFNGTTTPCEAMGQGCADATNTTAAMGDWVCQCLAPLTGTQPRGPAVCALDECAGPCPTCANETAANGTGVCTAAGQTCLDNNTAQGSLGDWECVCDEPSVTRAVVSAALCVLDECLVYNIICGVAVPPQDCVDNNHTQPMDWQCVCAGEAVGSNVTGVAAECVLDECTVNSTCHDAGQLCVDANETEFDSWHCACARPDEVGADVLMGAADCEATAECRNNTVCSDAGQLCHDPSNLTQNDWQCVCLAPYAGPAGNGSLAHCEYDECSAADGAPAMCATYGQDCFDTDNTTSGTWECRCRLPATGVAGDKALAEDCELDECAAACDTCAEGLCEAWNQTCVDERKGESDLQGWECRCTNGSPNVATAQRVPSCLHNECDDNAATCTGATPAQVCVDPHPESPDDWECHCAPGTAVGIGLRAEAAGCGEFNECLAECDHCADTGSGNVCAGAPGHPQTCVDDPPYGTHLNWRCVCALPSSTSNGTAPVAECALDECAAACPSCAVAGGVNVCEASGQTCEEGAKTVASRGDWLCRCPAPLAFVTAPAGRAECQVDECTYVLPGQAAPPGSACAGQVCHDGPKRSLGDFECSCAAPQAGRAVGAAAACTLDECAVLQNAQECADGLTTPGEAAPQACHDRNRTQPGDWECRCPLPSHGHATAAAAACGVDECEANGHECTSQTPPQQCVDDAPFALGDWECRCPAPASGVQRAGAAACVLDECNTACGTCENSACMIEEQYCEDPAKGVQQTRDWVCHCYAPSTRTAVGAAVSECTFDECTEGPGSCPDGQHCEDSLLKSQGNWECLCLQAVHVRATAGAAACPVDECADAGNGGVCARAGQVCFDDAGPEATGNWECRCDPTITNGGTAGQPASCILRGECQDAAVADKCAAAGQVCFDPDESNDGTWVCECVGAATGEPAQGRPAECVLDECMQYGPECVIQGMECRDADKSPLSLQSWACVGDATTSVTPTFDGAAPGAAGDCDGGFAACYWWLVLLLSCCCCCCIAVAAFMLRRVRGRAGPGSEEQNKWNKKFEGIAEGIDEDMTTVTLLLNETESVVSSTPAQTPGPNPSLSLGRGRRSVV